MFNRPRTVIVLALGSLLTLAPAASALSPYFDQLRFVSPAWSPSSAGTTSQQWDDLPPGSTSWNDVTPTGSVNNFKTHVSLADPVLSVGGAINETPYIFIADTIVAQLRNFDTNTDSPILNRFATRVQVQIAQTVGSAGDPFNPQTLDYAIAPGTLQILAGGITYLPTGPGLLLDSRPAANGFAFNFNGTDFPVQAQQWRFDFELPAGGDFTLSWGTASHSVFEALRVDTLLITPTVPEPTAALALLPLAALSLRRFRRQGVSK